MDADERFFVDIKSINPSSEYIGDITKIEYRYFRHFPQN